MIYLHIAMFNGKVLEDLKAPSGTPMWQLFKCTIQGSVHLISQRPKAPFFDLGMFQPRLMTPTARMSFIPRLVWTQVLQMHLSSTGGAMPHCSGAHGFLIILRIRNDDDQKQR